MGTSLSTWSFWKTVVAISCITGPVEPDPKEFRRIFPEVRQAILQVAVEWEILDPTEVKSWFSEQTVPTVSELDLLRSRWKELCDAPYLSEAKNLPSREMADDALSFNRAYQQDLWARDRIDALHRHWIRGVMQENDKLYWVWNHIRNAQSGHNHVTLRRQALKSLRELIGVQAYYSGRVPASVPMWSIPYAD